MPAALYALLCLIWGSTWLGIKIGLVGVPPFLGAGLRFLVSTLLVGLVLAARRTRVRLTRDDRVCILSLGLLVFWLDYAAVYWAETKISSGLTAILFSTMPLMTSLLSAYWTRSEILSGRKVLGILVGVLGTALLFWPQERLGPGCGWPRGGPYDRRGLDFRRMCEARCQVYGRRARVRGTTRRVRSRSAESALCDTR